MKSLTNYLKKNGFKSEFGVKKDFSDLADDISASDKFELGRTRRNNWQAELEATRLNAHICIAVRHFELPGVALFGATKAKGTLAQVWFLQSAKFTETTQLALGRRRAFAFHSATKFVIEDLTAEYGSIFNFVPASQKAVIKWLKHSGFSFFEHPGGSVGVLFFGIGPEIRGLGENPSFWERYFPQLSTS